MANIIRSAGSNEHNHWSVFQLVPNTCLFQEAADPFLMLPKYLNRRLPSGWLLRYFTRRKQKTAGLLFFDRQINKT
ncbi:hypothetical protein RBB74_03945 [Tunturiibacter gelidiferens]|uniref:hypothetical protein n=1 Tax=Tunturiibacter gelidiferens TaxID=3069689 RepID=UPI003D9BF5BE